MSLLIALLGASALHRADPSGTGAKAPQVSVTEGGITLTLDLPRDTYPFGALVRSRVTVTNATQTPIQIGWLGCDADGPSPRVEVLDSGGSVVFPSALPRPPLQAACVQPAAPTLVPGAKYSRSFFVLLRGGRVRAELTVPGLIELVTPTLPIHLGRGVAPTISLKTSPTVHARIRGPAPALPGKLFYTDWYVCGSGSGAYVGGQQFVEQLPDENGGVLPTYSGLVMAWTRTSRYLVPGCPHPKEWHVAAGWLNGPVAYLNYGGS